MRSSDVTRAGGFMVHLALLQILLDPLGLAEQERDMDFRRRQEFLHGPQGFLELLAEFLVLLVPPGVAEADELAVEDAHAVLQFGVEFLERLSEPPDFGRIDDGLGHDSLLRWTCASIVAGRARVRNPRAGKKQMPETVVNRSGIRDDFRIAAAVTGSTTWTTSAASCRACLASPRPRACRRTSLWRRAPL